MLPRDCLLKVSYLQFYRLTKSYSANKQDNVRMIKKLSFVMFFFPSREDSKWEEHRSFYSEKKAILFKNGISET